MDQYSYKSLPTEYHPMAMSVPPDPLSNDSLGWSPEPSWLICPRNLEL